LTALVGKGEGKGKGKGKGKGNVDLYSTFIVTHPKGVRTGSHSFTCIRLTVKHATSISASHPLSDPCTELSDVFLF